MKNASSKTLSPKGSKHEAAFAEAFRGIPAYQVAKAINLQMHGVDWRGCSKTTMAREYGLAMMGSPSSHGILADISLTQAIKDAMPPAKPAAVPRSPLPPGDELRPGVWRVWVAKPARPGLKRTVHIYQVGADTRNLAMAMVREEVIEEGQAHGKGSNAMVIVDCSFHHRYDCVTFDGSVLKTSKEMQEWIDQGRGE